MTKKFIISIMGIAAAEIFTGSRQTIHPLIPGLKQTFIPALLLAVSLLANCDRFAERPQTPDPGVNDPSRVQTTNGENTSIDNDSSNSICSNDYYPVSPSIKRKYDISGPSHSSYLLKQEITGTDGFMETREFEDGLTVSNNWICTDEGLRNAEYTNSISMPNAAFEIETLKSSGVTVPKHLESGKKWITTYEVVAKMNAGPVKTTGNGNISINNKIVSLDDVVSIREKEYTAARIDSDISLSLTMQGHEIPGIKIRSSTWFAHGIGIVKQESKGAFGTAKVEYIGEQ